MDYGSVKLYLDCHYNRHSIVIKLHQDRVEGWDYNKIRHLGVEPEYITGFTVAPRTVIEIFSGWKFDGKKWIIKNAHHNKTKHIDLACGKNCNHEWFGKIKSIKIWEIVHHDKRHIIPYCNSDNECPDDYYCLCPRGEDRADLCPLSKRRCMHKSKHIQSKPKDIHDNDLVDVNCLMRLMEQKNVRYDRFNNIKHLAEQCYGMDIIEPDVTNIKHVNPERADPTILDTNTSYLNVTDPEPHNNLLIEGFAYKTNNLIELISIFLLVFIIIMLIGYFLQKYKNNTY